MFWGRLSAADASCQCGSLLCLFLWIGSHTDGSDKTVCHLPPREPKYLFSATTTKMPNDSSEIFIICSNTSPLLHSSLLQHLLLPEIDKNEYKMGSSE